MKKIITLILIIFSTYSFSQDESATSDHNKWTVEVNVGQTKGVKPYKVGYFSSKANGLFGQVEANSFALSVRKMFSEYMGLRFTVGFDKITPNGNNESLPFEMQQITFAPQLYVNALRVFNSQEQFGRWGLLFHGGIQFSRMTSNTPNVPGEGEAGSNIQNNGVTEYNGGIMVGVTPQYRVAKRLALMLDFTNVNNYRQHFNWDGSYSTQSNNLAGQQITVSLGLSYSFGNENLHGDWARYDKDNDVNLDGVNKRIDKLEELMNDTDKDGVPDSIDQENNSVAGVAVDTRGKMVDVNRDGVPDELEKKLDDKYSGINSNISNSNTNNKEIVEKLINDGYIAAYFDFNKSQPTNESTEGIDFILTYLRNNPESTLEIYGHADVIGNSPSNVALSDKRANAVKEILTKAGISASRINVLPKGEDNSVDASSEGARSLVRRVTFKVKN